MTCRIARAYHHSAYEVWHWPLSWWRRVRDELVDSWKTPRSDTGGGLNVIEF